MGSASNKGAKANLTWGVRGQVHVTTTSPLEDLEDVVIEVLGREGKTAAHWGFYVGPKAFFTVWRSLGPAADSPRQAAVLKFLWLGVGGDPEMVRAQVQQVILAEFRETLEGLGVDVYVRSPGTPR